MTAIRTMAALFKCCNLNTYKSYTISFIYCIKLLMILQQELFVANNSLIIEKTLEFNISGQGLHALLAARYIALQEFNIASHSSKQNLTLQTGTSDSNSA